MSRYRLSAMSESYVSRCVACPSTTSTMHAKRALSQKGTRRRGRCAPTVPVAGGTGEEDAAAAAGALESVMAGERHPILGGTSASVMTMDCSAPRGGGYDAAVR